MVRTAAVLLGTDKLKTDGHNPVPAAKTNVVGMLNDRCGMGVLDVRITPHLAYYFKDGNCYCV